MPKMTPEDYPAGSAVYAWTLTPYGRGVMFRTGLVLAQPDEERVAVSWGPQGHRYMTTHAKEGPFQQFPARSPQEARERGVQMLREIAEHYQELARRLDSIGDDVEVWRALW